MRIVSWNVENIGRFLKQPQAIVEAFGRPDVLMLQEIRVRPADHELIAAMKSALPGFDCHFALADDPKNVTFRGGRMYGVATWAREALRARPLPPPPWDREGRVVAVTLGDLSIVNVYAVNGTDKRHWDHELGRYEGDRHGYKQRFQRLVAQYGDALPGALVLGGDWNVTPTAFDTTPRLRTEEPHATARWSYLHRLMPDLDVVDAFREKNPELRKYSWFRPTRSGRLDAARVDHVLVSSQLLSRVTHADIDDDPAHRFGSDHAPIIVDIERQARHDAAR